MIFIKDQGSRIIYANAALLTLYPPFQRDSIVGHTDIDHFVKVDSTVYLEEDRKAFETGFSELIESITDYRGETRIFQTRKTRFISLTGEPHIFCSCFDISKWAHREKELASANLALENFAAIAAHDLRSPLGSIISGLDLLKLDSGSKLTKNAQNMIDVMHRTCDGLMGQITSLLTAYKSSHDKKQATCEVDIDLLLGEIKINLGQLIRETGAKILSSNLPRIHADRHLFRQLLHNLIENSIKYRSSETPIIIMRCTTTEDNYMFAVEDNGIGIKAEHAQQIFQLYEQPDAAIDGYGIGLSLCKKIVEQHRGKIWVDTDYKFGCRICFSIPRNMAENKVLSA